MTLGEDVWNVPFKARKMNIERQWENTSGILSEVKLLSSLSRPAKKRFWKPAHAGQKIIDSKAIYCWS